MTIEFMDSLYGADRDMRRDGRTPTHWLMSPEAHARVKHEASMMTMIPVKGGVEHDEFLGYRIYLDRSLPDGAWSLGEGTPPDTVREDDCRRQLDELHRRFREMAEPLIKEMAEIEARKPPKPWIMDAAGKLVKA